MTTSKDLPQPSLNSDSPLNHSRQENSLEILYNEGGVLIIRLKDPTTDLSTPTIRNAFTNSGIDPDIASRLLLDSLTPNSTNESDQYIEDALAEHVTENAIVLPEGGEVRVYKVGYYPAATSHKDDPSMGVHTRDTEVIFGTGGEGVLALASGIQQDEAGNLTVPRANLRRITISPNVLAILPPSVQGNRWVDIPEPVEGKPGFNAVYFAFPEPYDSSTIKQATIQ